MIQLSKAMDGMFITMQLGFLVLLMIPGYHLEICKQQSGGTWSDCKLISHQEPCLAQDTNTTISDFQVMYDGAVLNLSADALFREPGVLELCVEQQHCWHACLNATGNIVVNISLDVTGNATSISLNYLPDGCFSEGEYLPDSPQDCIVYDEHFYEPIDNTSFRYLWSLSPCLMEKSFTAEIYTGDQDLQCGWHGNKKVSCNFTGQETLCTNVSHGFYCAEVVWPDNFKFVGTVNFTGIPSRGIQVETPTNEGAISIMMASLVLFLVFGGVFFAARYAVSQRNQNVLRLSEDRSSVDETFPMLIIQSRVLLLYSYDGGVMDGVMNAFKVLLQSMDVKVLDPLQDNFLSEELATNPSGWLLQHLNSSSTKIIIVLTDGAAVRQRALLHSKSLRLEHPHPRDDIFTYALQNLHKDSQLGQNYKRVFIVRFNDIPSQAKNMPLIVPMHCITLPRHLDYLCKVIHSSVASLAELQVIYRTKIESLQQAINNLKHFIEENPNYLSRLYSIEKDDTQQEYHITK